MTEEINEVNDPSQGVESSTTEEQTESFSEEVKPQEVDVREEYEKEKNNLRNIREAIKREKEKLDSYQNQTPQEPAREEYQEPADDVQRRFVDAEAKANLAYIAQVEPTFKEIAPLVYKKVEQGMAVEQAIRETKASLYDRLISEASKADEVPINKPNQLRPKAEPEPERVKLSGNVLKDAAKGKYDNIPPELQNTLRRVVSDLG